MIPTMSGLARPEILATTEWLAENLGQFGIKVLDLRWRPDGSAPAVHAAGHIPGAALVDWRTDLVDEGESGEAIVLTGPDRMAALAVRAGITDDTTVVVYDDTQSLFAARAWWSLRAYGLDSVRILDGGYPDWAAEGREISNARVPLGKAGFTVRGPNRTRLTTSDVRGLLGSPDVTLLDARAPAEYHGFEGNTKRLGHIPGAVNVPVGATSEPGRQRLRDGAVAARPAPQGQRGPRPPDGLLRRIGGRGRQAGVRADPARPRGCRGLRRRLGRVGQPARPARRSLSQAAGLAASRPPPSRAFEPAVTSSSAPCWRPSYSAVTVSTVSISSTVLSGRRRTIRGKRSENPEPWRFERTMTSNAISTTTVGSTTW